MRFPRSSGILMHITSLPGQLNYGEDLPIDFGIGDLGTTGFEFVDFLNRTGQTIWQILPLCPTSEGNSPYSSYSAFAGNPLLISPQALVEDGWLDSTDSPELEDLKLPASQVDFESVKTLKQSLLKRAYHQSRDRLKDDADFATFCNDHAWWLEDLARFEALMNHFGESDWSTWPVDLIARDPEALSHWDKKLADEIQYSCFVQFLFESQWTRLKQYANQKNVRIYGDMPIFVAHKSADAWANQSQFHLDEQGKPKLVAGVPPDYFSETGQLWGNPLYRWDVMEANDYAWWTGRFKRALHQYDLLRVDHFRGFESYWAIPADAETAIEGQWQPGPQHKPFEAAEKVLGELPIIAEDLGLITQEVHDLRDQLGFPPMRVMQFGFASEEDDFHRPGNYPEHAVAYTGTHDNETTQEWFLKRQTQLAESSSQCDLLENGLKPDTDVHWQLIEMVLSSAADTAIIPMQDVLGLGAEARMNIPGKADGNWRWRIESDQITENVESQLLSLTKDSNRRPDP